jgi:hypothetical protein
MGVKYNFEIDKQDEWRKRGAGNGDVRVVGGVRKRARLLLVPFGHKQKIFDVLVFDAVAAHIRFTFDHKLHHPY